MRIFTLFFICLLFSLSSSAQNKTTQVAYSGTSHGYYVKASGVLDYYFTWVAFPEIKAGYQNLEITHLEYKGVLYDVYNNRGAIQFPYSCKGFTTPTTLKASLPLGEIHSVTKDLWTLGWLTGYDFTSSTFKRAYNDLPTAEKEKVQQRWENSAFVLDASIVSINRSLINNIVDDIESTLRDEQREKERKEEEERLKKEEEERQRKEKEEEERRQRERVAEEKRIADRKEKDRKNREREKKEKKEREEEERREKERQKEVSNNIKLYGEAYNKARNAEAAGNLNEALKWYRIADSYSYNPQVRQKIQALEQQNDLTNMAAGAATFITGFNSAFEGLDEGRLVRGTMTSAFHYAESTYKEEFASRGSKAHFEGFMAFDFYMWMVRQKLAFHLGIFGNYAASSKELTGDARGFDSEKLELGATSGINFFGLLEVDYLYRALKLDGEYRYVIDNPNGFGLSTIEVPFGGGLHFDGGLRAAIYLARKKHFFIRTSAWYINGSGEGMLAMVDPTPADQTTFTESQGFRIELVKRPWSFSFFRSYNAYYNLLENNLSVDTWGIGLLFGGGLGG